MSGDFSLRGKCREMSEAAVAADPSLTLVRGFYHCPIWGKQAHWWTRRADGTLYDPTVAQFPSNGFGDYEEYDGTVECDECHKRVPEAEAHFDGNGRYAFCSHRCGLLFVGLEPYERPVASSLSDRCSP
jgi:hypothetical protein